MSLLVLKLCRNHFVSYQNIQNTQFEKKLFIGKIKRYFEIWNLN